MVQSIKKGAAVRGCTFFAEKRRAGKTTECIIIERSGGEYEAGGAAYRKAESFEMEESGKDGCLYIIRIIGKISLSIIKVEGGLRVCLIG